MFSTSRFDKDRYQSHGNTKDRVMLSTTVIFSQFNQQTNQYQRFGQFLLLINRKSNNYVIIVMTQQKQIVSYVQVTRTIDWIIQSGIYCTYMDAGNKRCLLQMNNGDDAKFVTMIALSAKMNFGSNRLTKIYDDGMNLLDVDLANEVVIMNVRVFDLESDGKVNDFIDEFNNCEMDDEILDLNNFSIKINGVYCMQIKKGVFVMMDVVGKKLKKIEQKKNNVGFNFGSDDEYNENNADDQEENQNLNSFFNFGSDDDENNDFNKINEEEEENKEIEEDEENKEIEEEENKEIEEEEENKEIKEEKEDIKEEDNKEVIKEEEKEDIKEEEENKEVIKEEEKENIKEEEENKEVIKEEENKEVIKEEVKEDIKEEEDNKKVIKEEEKENIKEEEVIKEE